MLISTSKKRRASTTLLVVFCLCLGGQVALADCPASPDHDETLRDLIEQTRAAPNESAGQRLGQEMWKLWADAPDEQAQEVLDRGMARRSSFDFAGALKDFDALVAYCPNYAEGYNQRAFVNFLSQNFAAAIPDLKKALELSPNHVAARAGLALTFMELGQLDAARSELKLALQDNPWLGERHLLSKGGRLAPKGEDI